MKLIKFYNNNCVPCKLLSTVLEDILPTEFLEYELVEVNVKENPEAVSYWNLRSVPTLVVMNGFEEEVDRMTGYKSLLDLKAMLTKNTPDLK
jgi:thioredoxin-like negative regulator of GroEL